MRTAPRATAVWNRPINVLDQQRGTVRLDLPKESSLAYFGEPFNMTQENLIGRTIAGYRLLDRIGEGGTATVYRAEHPERGTCAVKLLRERMRNDPTAVKRFLREAGYGTRVSHDAVIRTYDFGEEGGIHYLALEWADGEPLSDQRLERRAPLNRPFDRGSVF